MELPNARDLWSAILELSKAVNSAKEGPSSRELREQLASSLDKLQEMVKSFSRLEVPPSDQVQQAIRVLLPSHLTRPSSMPDWCRCAGDAVELLGPNERAAEGAASILWHVCVMFTCVLLSSGAQQEKHLASFRLLGRVMTHLLPRVAAAASAAAQEQVYSDAGTMTFVIQSMTAFKGAAGLLPVVSRARCRMGNYTTTQASKFVAACGQ